MAINKDLKSKIDRLRDSIIALRDVDGELHSPYISESLDEIKRLERQLRKQRAYKQAIISFRLRNPEEKEKLVSKAKALGMTITEYIRQALQHYEANAVMPRDQESIHPRESTDTNTISKLATELEYMFLFFQKNKDNLEISADDRKRLKEILSLLKMVR